MNTTTLFPVLPSERRRGPSLPRERLAHLAAKIHSLGSRPLYELFRELQDGKPFAQTLERYAELEPLSGFIAEHGGASFRPPRPVGRDAA